MIRFEGVHIGYSGSLLQVNFEALNAGQTYALIGENGSGKSTFLKTISGHIRPFKGEILINGTSISLLTKNQIAKKLAYVPTQTGVISSMNAFDFIGLGRTPYLNALGRLTQVDEQMIHAAMEVLNIGHLKSKMLDQLSDGERQLCAIASAICQETSIILLDEPTSFLDYKNKVIVLKQLNYLASEFGKCIIFSTHDLDLVAGQQGSVIYKSNSSNTLNLLFKTQSKEELVALAF